jgi:multicomponent K+:H+ antiporter subunit E
MNAWLRHPVYCGVLALTWMVLNESFTLGDLVVGYGLGLLILLVHRDFWTERVRVVRPGTALRLVAVFGWEIVKANLQVARIVLAPRIAVQPAFIALPLRLRNDLTITMLANMITLTPGTLSVDVADDRSALYVHCLSAADVESVREQILRDFEQPLTEIVQVTPL